MSDVDVFDRFIDALDRRAVQTSEQGYGYKAGFYESFLRAIVAEHPQIAGQVIVMTHTLEKWADEHEQAERERLTEM